MMSRKPDPHVKPHPHPPHHSGDPPWNFGRTAPRKPAHPSSVGTVPHAVQTCLAVLRGLPTNRDRTISLGVILARLTESEHIKGLSEPLERAMQEVNHYG